MSLSFPRSSSFPRSGAISALVLACGIACVAAQARQASPAQAGAAAQPPVQADELRVCADPDNMPFSNRQQQGFENRIAQLVGQDLHAHVSYIWQRMGRGFIRDYLDTSKCDLLIGIPSNYRPVLTTTPYYRSTYVFIVRRDRPFQSASLNDPALRQMKIGVQALDEDYTPPAAALARRGMQNEIVGFGSTDEDANSIVQAVVNRKVDTAIVWGPLAGYFALRYGNLLKLVPVTPEVDPPGLPFTFAISMGVRKGNIELRDRIEDTLIRRQADIQAILRAYGVPLLDMPSPAKIGE
jgi:mxaJ protein